MALSFPTISSLRVVTILSTIMGVLQSIVSSIFLTGVKKMRDDGRLKSWCKVNTENNPIKYVCDLPKIWCLLAVVAVIIGGIQVVCGLIGFKTIDRQWKPWCGVHVVIFLAAITTFSLSVEKNVSDELVEKILSKEITVSKIKAQWFLAVTALNFIFFVPALTFIALFARKSNTHS